MPNKQQIIEQLADKYRVPKKEVEKAVNSQFKFAKQLMQQPDMPQVRLPFWGVFKPNVKQIKKIQEVNERTRNKDKKTN